MLSSQATRVIVGPAIGDQPDNGHFGLVQVSDGLATRQVWQPACHWGVGYELEARETDPGERAKEAHMPYLPNDDCGTDSNPGGSGLGGYGDEESHRSAAHSPAFEKWLNNYRKQLDKVLRGERGEEISEHGVLLPRGGRSEQAPGRM